MAKTKGLTQMIAQEPLCVMFEAQMKRMIEAVRRGEAQFVSFEIDGKGYDKATMCYAIIEPKRKRRGR